MAVADRCRVASSTTHTFLLNKFRDSVMHSYAGASANTVNDTEKRQITRSGLLAGPKMEIGSKICISGEKASGDAVNLVLLCDVYETNRPI